MKHGIFRIFKVLKFSYSGIKYLFKDESFRQELFLGTIGWGLLYYFNVSTIDLIVFSFLLLGLFSAEALNTALERIADKIDSSINPFTKEVKDLGAVAVFFWIIPIIVWWVFAIIKVI